MKRSPLFIIFTTVAFDLVGFGMVIPLIGLYGRHYGATGISLALLGGIYSLMQFFFSPFWGAISDRVGRRPILLLSLGGQAFAYLLFGLAPNFYWLLLARACSGLFAANISTAQAYIADITTREDRAKGMGLVGAAFGIGFTIGPALGGIAAKQWGLGAPGFVAAAICGLNCLVAFFRLPESLPVERRNRAARRALSPLSGFRLLEAGELRRCLITMFFTTLAFSAMEQVFSLLVQVRFFADTAEAGYHTGLVLMFSGVLGATIQGGLIRKLVPRFGEHRLLITGFLCNAFGMFLFPHAPYYGALFGVVLPIAVGSGLINPSLASLTSKAASAERQGEVFGMSQGLGSLARATGPMVGLLTFGIAPWIPFTISATLSVGLFLAWWKHRTLHPSSRSLAAV